MRIYVKQEDIDTGTRGNGWDCMVARAIKRQFLNVKDIGVGYESLVVNSKKYVIPKSVGEKIINWDYNIDPKPFSFELGRGVKQTVGILLPA